MARRSDPAALIREYQRRHREAELVQRFRAQQATAASSGLDLDQLLRDRYLFDRQHEVLTGPGNRKVVRASRRAGKTRAFALALLHRVTQPPYTNVFYIAPTQLRAKKLLLGVLTDLNRRLNLGGELNAHEGYVRFPHLGADCHVYLGGLKDRSEADKLRGIEGKFYILDEAQDNREDVLEYALNEVIGAALLDHDGELWVGGTPGQVKAGFFYDIDEGDQRDYWEHYFWTWRDNTLLPRRLKGQTVEQIEAAILDEFGLTPESGAWLREWCGLWHESTDNRIWSFDHHRNGYDRLPEGRVRYVCGVDLGFEHNDSVAVWGYVDHDPSLYLVYTYRENHKTISDLAEVLKEVNATYRPSAMVIDEQGGGKKIAEELRRQHGLPLTPAAATEKLTVITLLQDALLTGRAKLPRNEHGARLNDEFRKAQWDLRAKKKGVLKVDDAVFHPDLAMSAAYALREAKHYRVKAKPAQLPEHERQLLEAQREQQRRREMPWWARDASDMGYDVGG